MKSYKVYVKDSRVIAFKVNAESEEEAKNLIEYSLSPEGDFEVLYQTDVFWGVESSVEIE